MAAPQKTGCLKHTRDVAGGSLRALYMLRQMLVGAEERTLWGSSSPCGELVPPLKNNVDGTAGTRKRRCLANSEGG